MLRSLLVSSLALTIISCASTPHSQAPAWTQAPTRIVDNGYIVYVGRGESQDENRAQFKAEGMALEDLANECSFLPKGTRLEDRYVEKGAHGNIAYVKVAVEFQECTEAQKALEPAQIQKQANTSFTEQLRRYQDLEETGELPDKSAYTALNMPAEVSPPPTMAKNTDTVVQFAVMRQYVAYQKQVVILSPPATYPPNSAQSTRFIAGLQPTVGQIEQTAQANPQIVKNPKPWSSVYDRPHIARPAGLAAKAPSTYKNANSVLKQNKNLEKNHDSKKKSKKGGGHKGGHHKTE